LDGYERGEFAHDGKARAVYRTGTGPAVIVVAEVPGITPRVAAFGRRMAERRMTAVLPHLFGEPGAPTSGGAIARTMLPLCVSREFVLLGTGRTSPVVSWLRALAAEEHQRCGAPGVGAVGMCLTGGFALGMMVGGDVVAPVLSQPSLPLPLGRSRASDLGLSPGDLAAVKAQVAAGTPVLGLRFTNDRACPPARFDRLRAELGDGFIAVELDSSPHNPYGHPTSAHSVLTENLDDREGTPTRAALDQVLDFLAERLGA
jgi:dienelactone hydrolase